MDKQFDFSLLNLVKMASENLIDNTNEFGRTQTSILLSYMPLIEFLSTVSRKNLTNIVFKKLCVSSSLKKPKIDIESPPEIFEIIEVFKL